MRRRLQMAVVVFSLTMFIGACGGGDDDDEGSTTATTARATVTTEQVGNALPRLPEVFAPIPGHTYVDLPESILTDLQDQFASDPDTREAVAAADGRSVTRAGEPVAVIIAVGFDEKSAALPGVEEGFVEGATEDAVPGSKKTLNLAGEEATFGTDEDGAHTIAWLGGTLALVIIGDDEPGITTVATALISANK